MCKHENTPLEFYDFTNSFDMLKLQKIKKNCPSWHKIPKYSSVTGVEPHGCCGCRLVFLGWILVAATVLLCGTFLLLHK